MSEQSITGIVEELHKTLGVPKPQQDIDLLRNSIMYGMDRLASTMARAASLPCTFRIRLAPTGWKYRKQKPSAAWIRIPRNLPQYEDPALEKVKMNIFMSEPFLRAAPLESIIFTIAHELSHIVLRSRRSPLAHSERATEVCAMMLGYDAIVLESYTYSELCVVETPRPWWKRLLGTRPKRITVLKTFVVGYLTADEYRTAMEDIMFLRALHAIKTRT